MNLPTPPEIADAPELAALAAADRVLVLMGRALVAAHPELVEQDPASMTGWPPCLRLANALIRGAADLQQAMDRYVAQLAAPVTLDRAETDF